MLIRRDADAGVRDSKSNVDLRTAGGQALRLDSNVAFLGELDCVAHEVDKDLPNTNGVAKDEIGNVPFHCPT